VIVSFVSGTGPAGFGLAARFARAGDQVVIGSRAHDRAEEARGRVLEHVPDARVTAAVNEEAVAAGEVVFLTMPASSQRVSVESVAGALAGKIVVSMSNPVEVRDGKVSTFCRVAGRGGRRTGPDGSRRWSVPRDPREEVREARQADRVRHDRDR
jgi:predicted dinucleotide-binding enzyme